MTESDNHLEQVLSALVATIAKTNELLTKLNAKFGSDSSTPDLANLQEATIAYKTRTGRYPSHVSQLRLPLAESGVYNNDHLQLVKGHVKRLRREQEDERSPPVAEPPPVAEREEECAEQVVESRGD